jgi:hypothetical protein
MESVKEGLKCNEICWIIKSGEMVRDSNKGCYSN